MNTLAEYAVAAAKTELCRADGRLCVCLPVDSILQVVRT